MIKFYRLLEMKKLRSISIRDPSLKKIRNNLRLLISHAVWDQLQSLKAIWDGLYSQFMSDEDNVKQGLIYTEILDLEEALRKSICQCGTCKSVQNDMIYFPSLRAWHCVECDNKGLIWFPQLE